MSTIAGTITIGVTLGTGTYTSPLSITYTGIVSVSGSTGADAIYAPSSYVNPIVVNQGLVTGGKGAKGATAFQFGGAGGTGGAGVDLATSGTASNTGTITGGSGGTGGVGTSDLLHLIYGTGGAGGLGGAGVSLFGSLTNDGRIVGGQGGRGGSGIYLGAGGTGSVGVSLSGGGAVTNRGTILGGSSGYGSLGGTYGYAVSLQGSGVAMADGGVLNNGTASCSTAVIGGRVGIEAYISAATIINFGTIVGTTDSGVQISGTAGSTIINFGTITGSSGAGIVLGAGGTVIDSGAISGGSGTALSFGGGGNLLALEAGYKLSGGVVGSGLGRNTLELAGSVGSAVTVTYRSLTLSNFTNVLFGTGGQDTLKVSNAAGTLTPVISGFSLTSDIIDLITIGTNGTISAQSSTSLTVTGSLGSETIRLDPSDATVFTTQSDGASGTEIVTCFCRGTMILTDRGEVAVEELAVGDRVKTLLSAFKPIHWIGFGRDLVTGRNSLARPVIVRAGALADNLPRRDLHLTHGHSLYLDGVLIPVENLVNHRSIHWDDTARVVEYYHIELEDHDVVFAEGAPAESYYDAGNRALFHNARAGSEAGTNKPTCAPVLTSGETVERVWAGLFARAGGQVERETTDYPDLHLVVDGERLDPASVAEGVYTFALAGPPDGTLLLSSSSGVPSLIGLNRHEHRRLGVAIRQIVLHQPGVMTCFDCDAPLFSAGGSHAAESGYSWTDGELILPAELFGHLKGAFTLLVHTQKQAMRYPISAAAAQAA